jgi:hypothetical protein
VAAQQSGHAIDGFCGWCHRMAGELSSQADEYFAMSRVSEEVARLLYGLREDLDEIDRKAEEEIQRLQQSPMRLGDAALRGQQIMTVVTAARAQAIAKCAEVAAAITKLGTQVGLGGESQGSAGGGNGSAPQQSGHLPYRRDVGHPQLRRRSGVR